MRFFLSLLLLLNLSNELFSQRTFLEEGDDFFHRKMYVEAIGAYKKALAEDVVVKKFYMTQQIAKTYKNLFDYANAAEWYEKLLAFKDENPAENLKEYGDILMSIEMYNDALTVYKQYCQRIGKKELENHYIRKCEWPDKNKGLTTKFDIIKSNIETGGRGLGITYYKDGLVYSMPQSNDFKEKTVFYDLALAKRTDSATFEPGIKLAGDINRDFYEASPVFSTDGKKILFTANASTETKYKINKKKDSPFGEKGINVLKIFEAEEVNGSWINLKELNINSNEYSCAFPFLTKDGKTLFFASDRPGGKGGFDLYYSTLEPGETWSLPKNLGDKINTPEDEFYPLIYNNQLYFSSRGLPGFGGADLFTSEWKNNSAGEPRNLGKPFNSPKDDFNIIWDEKGKEGFLISNRETNQGYDRIYFFRKMLELDTLRGTVLDIITSKPVEGAKVDLYLIDTATGDSTLVSSRTTGKDGKWEFIVHPEKTYKVNITMPGYVTQVFTIPPSEEGTNTKRGEVKSLLDPLRLKPEVKKNNIVRIDNIYFDFNEATLRPESFGVLDNLVTFLKENPTAKVELSAHTDAIGKDAYNMTLSSKRAQSCNDYLIGKGILQSQIVPKGYGENKLLNNCKTKDGCSEEEHAINRRVEVKFL